MLGTFITDDLKWDVNCSYLVRKFYGRMQLLHKVSSFGADTNDLRQIYITFCRPILEQCCEVWATSITIENKLDLERCQMSAIKLINKHYTNYKDSLRSIGLEDLESRRQKLLYRFATKSIQHEKMKHFFQENKKIHNMETRHTDKFQVIKANTARFQNSTIIQMQHMMNRVEKKK